MATPKIRMRTLYCDIDGTLTDHPMMGGTAIPARIATIKQLITQGVEVIIWTGDSISYAQQFCDDNGIKPTACLRKPDVIVDDNHNLRPPKKIERKYPEEFFGKS